MTKNRLSNEKSPYLAQHAANPVWWYSWGEEAFKAAKDQGKPIFLSIGYATCYWCHVMEQDSFEKQEVADVLNREFISIKIDREERPDVDAIYMQVLVALTGHGGWPLSVALTPDLKPFWAGTFFYKDQFIQVLEALARAWKEDQVKVVESASEVTSEVFKSVTASEHNPLNYDPIENAVATLSQNFDSEYGGFFKAPKFPPVFQLALLLNYLKHLKDPNKRDPINSMLQITLDNMIAAGIHDQVGGGFHRYATDQAWVVPHFEKMLYDNAQLCYLLCQAFEHFSNPRYLYAAKRAADYVIRDLKSEQQGFFSAQDAGEVGKEGEFYVFSYTQLKQVFQEKDFDELTKIFNLSEDGNFEGNNIIVERKNISDDLWEKAKEYKAKLFEFRSKREAPSKDIKIIASWNALMIRALVKLYQVSSEEKYLLQALKTTAFVKKNLWKDSKLYRRSADGEVGILACLEDYAFTIEALLELHAVTKDPEHLSLATDIQSVQDSLFWSDEKGAYFDSIAPELISRRVEITDGAIPAGNSVAAKNLISLSKIKFDKILMEKAKKILDAFEYSFENYPHAVCRALESLSLYLN